MTPYQYVVLRCVPRVDREEFVNVGVVVYCQARDSRSSDFLAASWQVDPARLQSLDPAIDPDAVEEALRMVDLVCAGDPAAGAAGRGSAGVRFGFLRAPRSTVLQPGPVHGGLAGDPAAALQELTGRLVR